jgi:Zn-dependent protease
MSGFDLQSFLIGLIVIIISISLHEFGHAISADRLGDDTPRRQGRVTLWPDKHFDPVGFIMIIFTLLAGFGLGWGKPVMVNPGNFRHPRRDMVIVAAFGPLMNLLLALFFGLILRFAYATGHTDWLGQTSGAFVFQFLLTNLGLMFFNLIPVHPLDGSKILSGLLPLDQAIRYDRFVGQYGPLVLIVLAFSGGRIIGQVISPAVIHTARLIIGAPG